MKVLVAGAYFKTGRRLTALLGDDDVFNPRAIVRDQHKLGEMAGLSAEPVVADLLAPLEHAVDGCDAIVCAIGDDPTNPEETARVRRDGVKNLIDTAVRRGVRRFVLLNDLGADEPDSAPEEKREILRAEHDAEAHLRRSGLEWTIVRAPEQHDDPGPGRIKADTKLDRHEPISRTDVARTLAACLDADHTIGKAFEISPGEMLIRDAVREI